MTEGLNSFLGQFRVVLFGKLKITAIAVCKFLHTAREKNNFLLLFINHSGLAFVLEQYNASIKASAWRIDGLSLM